MPNDQRKSRRHFVAHGARVVWDGGSSPQDCRMLDVSAHGARLELDTVQRYRTNSCYCFRMMVVYAVNAL